jgi:hypothetical protein
MRHPNKFSLITRKFNSKRSPECRARLLKRTEEGIIVEFTGTKASFACCFDENFIDYAYMCQDNGLGKYKIEKISRPETYRFIVHYRKLNS